MAVVNASAGTAYRRSVDAVTSFLASASARRGTSFELARTEDLDALDSALGSLDGRQLVLLGGDGSVHAAIQCLHQTGALGAAGPIGIIPVGTGNDLARSLKLPADPLQAAECVMSGQARTMELLVSEDRTAVNAVHVGIGADAAAKGAELKQKLKKVKAGKLGYPLGAVAAGFSSPGQHLSVRVDGELLHDGSRPLLMAALGLGGTVGGGARLIPDANPHDGFVDVVLWESVGPAARVGYALGLKSGDHARRTDVRIGRGEAVEITVVDGDGFRVSNDGELWGPFQHRRWDVVCDAWQVIAPQ
ncbi:diacylglycerol/lipid kinase family protein [Arthrobacter tumbae]|uniref:diacylglycerol/lipid kinase family protein n=1 Tax=Arthrobacter tumbae TaxID=163874 RepID=UPI00195A05D7|nr:diacylglycerol kinase family protein [Arthrobacter tumbae]MBM7780786.1 diacylglycerol kinase family enzyme [Arthrobacter tumbae]